MIENLNTADGCRLHRDRQLEDPRQKEYPQAWWRALAMADWEAEAHLIENESKRRNHNDV